MHVGIAQSLAYFTALMQRVLVNFGEFCFFHMDDLFVHNAMEKHHLKHLKMIIENIREAG